MIRHKEILKYKSVILLVGVFLATTVIVGPFAMNEVAQLQQHEINEASAEDSEKQQDEVKLSALDAVSQVVQGNWIPVQKITEELNLEHVEVKKIFTDFIIDLPGKLFNILFRTIISPNAP